MKRYLQSQPIFSLMLSLLLAASILPITTYAATVNLATAPLASSTTTSVLPNLMFILDNSGSMKQDYTPDYMSDVFSTPATNDRNCRDSGDDDTGTVYSGVASGSTRVLDMCVVGDVPYMNSDMNSQYYNPAIRYTPGVNFDGVSRGDQSDPTNVRTDSYNKQNTTQLQASTNYINITTAYPDRVWCTKINPTALELTDTSVCRKNSDYLYPNATFKYGRTTGSPNQQASSSMLSEVIKVFGAPYYYSVVPTEYCTAADLRTCVLSTVPTSVSGLNYNFPARSRWCSNTSLTDCQSIRSGSYVYPRYVGVSGSAGTAASGWFKVSGTSKSKNFTSIKVGTTEILGATVSWGNTENDAGLAALVAARINTYVSNPEYTATINSGDSTRIDIVSTISAGAAANGNVSRTGTASISTPSGTDITGGVGSASSLAPYTFTRTDIVSANNSYLKALARTDCLGASCTYAEEITNFGNWYTYYRTRMQAMKTAASLAFKPIDNRFRVGFITIASQSSNYLPIDKFDAGVGSQKDKWYTKLFGIAPSSSTPLRSALSMVGRIYAGQNPVGASDPVQYSCQQNFALLTTDGYWNTDSASDVLNVDASGSVGNKDSDSSTRPMYEGPTASSNSLADVAKYYYDTDLRDSGLSNCTGSLGIDVCENNVFVSGTDNNVKQHMTTFTLGLGVDGTLMYTSDYKTAESGDFYNLKNGLGSPTVNWPVPVADTEAAVDDLWHAAVNGQGTYFSAKDPAQLTKGLSEALAQINSKVGAGAAAATSTLNPVAGDNFAYVASYTTVKWTGNLEARTINTNTGEVSEAAFWCAEDVVNASCPAPSSIVAEVVSGSTVYNCVTPSAASCSGVWDGTSCKVEVPKACTGTMAAKASSATDTRTIYMNKAGLLTPFTYVNLTAAQQENFKAPFLASNLSQWTSLDPTTQQLNAKENNLVNFLRGQNGFEDRGSNAPVNRLFRYREAILGDALESTPFYVGKPKFDYTDAGYDAFKTAQASRAGTVYLGTNDGMLHAFDAVSGNERWAYVPSMVIPNMWKLADKNYATMHTNYVNGDPTVFDICTASCTDTVNAVWKTILVGGLNAGGQGYYALDITVPNAPVLLWEFGNANNCEVCTSKDAENDLGYSFGNPIVTKKNNTDGTQSWVVLVSSGYNNTGGSNPGKGFLYVLDAVTGSIIPGMKMPTGAGDGTTPSGLAKVAAWADNPVKNNTSIYVYSGDLSGNLWRFDINAPVSATNPILFAKLLDSSGAPQPITARPELSKISGKRVVFVGTGKYLELSDLTDTQQQSLYAIKDDDTGTTVMNPRATLIQQILGSAGANRTGSTNSVDFNTDPGWYVNFPDPGERQNVAGVIVAGSLLVPTTVPSNTVCSPGGTSWFNYFDYKTGQPPSLSTGYVSTKTNAPIVGFNVMMINKKPVVSVVTADKPTPELLPNNDGMFKGGGGLNDFNEKRVIWRELID